MRIVDHPVLGRLNNEEEVYFQFDGNVYSALKGDSIAAALLANNIRTLRYSEKNLEPRGIYCGIGHCYECRVTVDEVPSVRACITSVEENMKITSQGTNLR
ncbi:(2Fe-2S)-binding protein [Ammoniphilus sp. CFH 90114]|uniref:(2Fe-2S)-binding protein n=1 Tax=Ammoniphilus sp. CFH 90114 TaxID=2493665 RepID=UPI00100E0D91|nr:(2Fe-2S)-binding protein [Ammoniphilus sp. CFH 90114]RXT06504.1 (2Fe-2S)-binding protein [Ammoniphilus sp. CFH 90114]